MTDDEPRKLFVFPCGCTRYDDKDSGPIDRDCGDLNCYRRTRPTGLVSVGRSARRRIERKLRR